jgi:hypothetical protein
MVEIFRPTGTVPDLPGNDTPALTWDFAYESKLRTFSLHRKRSSDR